MPFFPLYKIIDHNGSIYNSPGYGKIIPYYSGNALGIP